MIAEQIKTAALKEIDEYQYEIPEGTIGTPFSEDRMKKYAAELRAKLISPYKAQFQCGNRFWILTDFDETDLCVFYDEDAQEYGLANSLKPGHFGDINVRGDLLGSYVAR